MKANNIQLTQENRQRLQKNIDELKELFPFATPKHILIGTARTESGKLIIQALNLNGKINYRFQANVPQDYKIEKADIHGGDNVGLEGVVECTYQVKNVKTSTAFRFYDKNHGQEMIVDLGAAFQTLPETSGSGTWTVKTN